MDTNFGFVRVAAAVPTMKVADCRYNAEQIKRQIDEAISEGVEVICFPEFTLKISAAVLVCISRLFLKAFINSSTLAK